MSTATTCPTCGHRVAPGDYGARVARLCEGKHVTPMQRETLETFIRLKDSKGFPPTQAEVAAERGVSKVTVFEAFNELIRAGVMRKTPNVSRGLDVVA